MATAAFSLQSLPYTLNLEKLKIGIACAEWNGHITSVLLDGAKNRLVEVGIEAQNIEIVKVPGAFELPTAAQWLFQSSCDAVINLGCIIKGDTPHFDYVSKAVTDGTLQMSLMSKKPCIFGVITANTEQEAIERSSGKLGNKGTEAAETALWMIGLKQHLIEKEKTKKGSIGF